MEEHIYYPDTSSLKPSDIGMQVVYNDPYNILSLGEEGVITSFNESYIFINFPHKDSSGRGVACRPRFVMPKIHNDIFQLVEIDKAMRISL